MINGNVLGGTLAQLIPLSLALLLFGKGERWGSTPWRLLLAPCLAAMVGALVLSRSRGGMLAAGLGAFILLLVRTRWTLAMLPVLAIKGYQVLTRGSELELLGQLNRYGHATSDVLGSWQGRLEIWRHGIDMIKDVPLTGAGLNAFSLLSPLHYPYWQLAGREPYPIV